VKSALTGSTYDAGNGAVHRQGAQLLQEAEAMLDIRLNDAAGRSAYLAGFHAAQAFISEKTDRTVKTHKGVHTEFQRLTKDDPTFVAELRVFLSHAYNLKALADYETRPDSGVSAEQAKDALAQAKRFVAHVGNLLA
jgi:uncharacterized protein (UPF0332 family)